MAKTWEMFDKVYLLIKAGYSDQARTLIEEILAREPQNIEAWEVYINTYASRPEFESLKKKVYKVWKMYVRDQDFMMANREYILRYLDRKIAGL
jgi:hypothetical protein